MASRPSPHSAWPLMPPSSRGPRLTAVLSNGWSSVANSMPCWRATERFASTCPTSSDCRSRLPPATSRCCRRSRPHAPSLPRNNQSGFMPADWRAYLVQNGKVDRRIWEMALVLAVRDALRAGGLYLVESREHVSFWNLIYDSRNSQEHPPRG